MITYSEVQSAIASIPSYALPTPHVLVSKTMAQSLGLPWPLPSEDEQRRMKWAIIYSPAVRILQPIRTTRIHKDPL